MSAINTCSVVSSLIPMFSEENRNVKESEMCAAAQLVAKTILGTIEALSKGNYKAFNPLVKDGGCQNQALELRRITQLDLTSECEHLRDTAEKLEKMVRFRKGNVQERQSIPPEAFFSKHVELIEVSKEMEYLLHCFLLTVTRAPRKDQIAPPRTESSRLRKLSKKITEENEIVRRAQVYLSLLNMEAIQREANRLATVENKRCVIEMLYQKHQHINEPTRGSLFYQVKTVLYRLREEGALIALKGYVADKNPFYLYLQPSRRGEPFELLSDMDVIKLKRDEPVVVVEACSTSDRSEVVEQIKKQGFTHLVLSCAAKDSDLSTVELEEAQLEIEAFRNLEKGCVDIKHVYLSTVGAEDETA